MPIRKHYGNHQFSSIPKATIERSTFDRSHTVKTIFNEAYLIPIFVDEVLPGDTFNLKMNAFARMATPLKPIMDNIYLDSFFFFVPNRLLWEHWQEFCGEQRNPGDSTDYTIPCFRFKDGLPDSTTPDFGTLFDYMGIPPAVSMISDEVDISSLPFRAYNLIWREFFRDQNLQDSPVVGFNDGPDITTDYVLLKRGKRHDYFTSCLPWPQKGPDVTIPISGGLVPVMGIGTHTDGDWSDVEIPYSPTPPPAQLPTGILEADLEGHAWTDGGINVATALNPNMYLEVQQIGGAGAWYPNVNVDISNAYATTINELRTAFQVQRLYERDARGGSRYTEIVRSHFGVVSPDARLQRPEYLGGGTTRINVHPLAQTSASGGTGTPQGNLAGFATAALMGHGFVKSFTEHGVILGMVSIRSDMTYQQGLNRMWSRKTRLDFPWPVLMHLGEQEVLNKEIYLTDHSTDVDHLGNDDVFGYQERFAECRYKPSMITGIMRSQAAQGMDVWHLAQDFGSMPTLGPDFIQENPPIDRIVAVDSEPHFYFDAWMDLKCTRPMPVYSVPGLIDHF